MTSLKLVLVFAALCGFTCAAPKPQDLYKDGANPYEFGYKIADEHGNQQHRQETGDSEGNKKGSYGYSDAYGLYRNVEYVADGYGFKAFIKSNEPGLGEQDPADATIEKSDKTPEIVHAPKHPGKKQVRGYESKAAPVEPIRQHPRPVHKVVHPKLPEPAPKRILPKHPAPARKHRRRPSPKRPLIHADPSFTQIVAQVPDLIDGPIIFNKNPAGPVPKQQIIRKERPYHPATLGKDQLIVDLKEPFDVVKIHRPAPSKKIQPIPHPDEGYEGPEPTLKTFTEKPSQRPEYRPRFASKSNKI